MENSNNTYRINAKYFYYNGTFGAPKDGSLEDEYGNILKFESKENAIKYCEENLACDRNQTTGKNWMFATGTYYLSHGEYDQPEFKVFKNRK